MAITIDNIIVGAGNLYIGSRGVNLPGQSAGTLDSTYHVGATIDGVEVAYEPDYTDIVVDQLKDAAMIFQNGFKLSVRTNLAEATLTNLKVAWGLQDVDQTGNTRLNIPISPDEPKERELLIVGRSPADTFANDKKRKYFGRRAMAVDTSSHSLKRAEVTMFPVSFRLLGDPAYTGSEYGYIEDEV